MTQPISTEFSLSHFDGAPHEKISSRRTLNGPKNKTTTSGSQPFADFGKSLQHKLRNREEVNLPVVCYYSSKRLWVHHKSTLSKSPSRARTSGYIDCLSSTSSYRQLSEWVKRTTLISYQNREYGKNVERASVDDQLRAVAHTVETILRDENWESFHYSVSEDELVMYHEEHGFLPLSLLSDGVRAMTAMAADLARRCCQLNPQFGELAPSKTEGIVLIDEVDLHLHPQWQQRVLAGLTEVFPKVQFIVSTHSPQVLSTVPVDQIRVIDRTFSQQWQVRQPQDEVVGLPSSVALSQIMGVDPQPPVAAAAMLNEYRRLIEAGSYLAPRAQELRNSLEDTYGDSHPVLRDADRLARFQKLKLATGQGSDNA